MKSGKSEKLPTDFVYRVRHSLHVNELKAKTCIKIFTPDEQAQQIVEPLVRAAHIGNSGDGKVFVWPVENAIRIQTGEKDEAAL